MKPTMSARVKISTTLLTRVTLPSQSSILTRRRVKFKRRRLKMLLKRFLNQLQKDQLQRNPTTTTRTQAVMKSLTELVVLKATPRREPRAKVNHQMTRSLETQPHKSQREVEELFNEPLARSSYFKFYLN